MFTVFDEDEGKFTQVQEPDPSLNYTYSDYLKWKFEERLELIRGKIFRMSPSPSPIHQRVASRFTARFENYLEKKPCQSFPAPFDVRLPVKNNKRDDQITTVVQPDLCVICDETKIDNRGCIGAPDLIIEILSPGNTEKEVQMKFELYEEAEVKEYWVVYPAEENAIVFNLDENNKFSGAKIYAGTMIIKSYAVQGFEIRTQEIFSK